MSLLALLKQEAVKRNLWDVAAKIDAAAAFYLVRDMPYIRASSRAPETIIREWRGTCSGKHYTLQALFAELDIPARVMACTTIYKFGLEEAHEAVQQTLAEADVQFVDVHNYLILELPDGDMVVDATWPLASKPFGAVGQRAVYPGEDQAIACDPIQTWVVPDEGDPQAFKNELLHTHFTAEELAHREEVITLINALFAA
ncbi:MAG: hypothetical protein M5U34_42760 [Chloroflexi bacterium]|nr:hypothetical protein [Chloroflexota bacterium]